MENGWNITIFLYFQTHYTYGGCIVSITKIFFDIFSNSQNSSVFSAVTGCNESKAQNRIKCLIKDDCIYHKHWYEPVNNDNSEPKHIQIDRCTFGLLAKGGCNAECTSYMPLRRKNNGI